MSFGNKTPRDDSLYKYSLSMRSIHRYMYIEPIDQAHQSWGINSDGSRNFRIGGRDPGAVEFL